MKLSDFDFKLPKELIAQTPVSPRNHSKLLVYDRQTKTIRDDIFYNLDSHLLPGTTLVLNDSKVEKSRLRVGAAEIFILEVINPKTIKALVRPGRKFQKGRTVEIKLSASQTLQVKVVEVMPDGVRILQLNKNIDDAALNKFRLTPFPPYIKQNEKLSGRYQTVYARPVGSKAAPTAGLHFTSSQLAQISKSYPIARLTLHVGLGTFAPIKDDITSHKMHSEKFRISPTAAARLNHASSLTAVGTTSLRVLETAGPVYQAQSGVTDIFITPGYNFKSVDSLITNFHLPKSSLLMLCAAFIGSIDELQKVYRHAIENQYRFYSFGDAMLIL